MNPIPECTRYLLRLAPDGNPNLAPVPLDRMMSARQILDIITGLDPADSHHFALVVNREVRAYSWQPFRSEEDDYSPDPIGEVFPLICEAHLRDGYPSLGRLPEFPGTEELPAGLDALAGEPGPGAEDAGSPDGGQGSDSAAREGDTT